MKELYEIYANNEFWDKTSCPFGTEVLTAKQYKDCGGELDFNELKDQLKAKKVKPNDSLDNYKFIENSEHMLIDFTDEGFENDPYTVSVNSLTYVYEGYLYTVHETYVADGFNGFNMIRRSTYIPQQ
tara:strand:- start:27 stop:407 length:381 start_codon:yes stop_codon:yes gene_type:complete